MEIVLFIVSSVIFTGLGYLPQWSATTATSRARILLRPNFRGYGRFCGSHSRNQCSSLVSDRLLEAEWHPDVRSLLLSILLLVCSRSSGSHITFLHSFWPAVLVPSNSASAFLASPSPSPPTSNCSSPRWSFTGSPGSYMSAPKS